ncbi:hypothetical protein CRG98_024977 [Punica granatum]|uniref:Uncharacterized protein n=1 Tax=Punica granatum TaxID=22663 RepID=A0A2I0JG54_PUNGR|nr:hypothetical protein CRG98_024977 [Punica granatum]
MKSLKWNRKCTDAFQKRRRLGLDFDRLRKEVHKSVTQWGPGVARFQSIPDLNEKRAAHVGPPKSKPISHPHSRTIYHFKLFCRNQRRAIKASRTCHPPDARHVSGECAGTHDDSFVKDGVFMIPISSPSCNENPSFYIKNPKALKQISSSDKEYSLRLQRTPSKLLEKSSGARRRG